MGNPYPIALRSGRVVLVYLIRDRRFKFGKKEGESNGVVFSDDDGVSWSAELDVSAMFGPAAGSSPGPGNGIETRRGTLVVVTESVIVLAVTNSWPQNSPCLAHYRMPWSLKLAFSVSSGLAQGSLWAHACDSQQRQRAHVDHAEAVVQAHGRSHSNLRNPRHFDSTRMEGRRDGIVESLGAQNSAL